MSVVSNKEEIMAAAVIVIAIAVITLAAMVGVGCYVVGRAHAADDAAEIGESLDELKDGVCYQSSLLIFTLTQAFGYREIASRAIAEMPADAPCKVELERKLQEIDAEMSEKVTEIEGYMSEKG